MIGDPHHVAGYPIIIIVADGWRRDVFLDCLSGGYLPEIRDELIAPGALLPTVICNLPSVSFASHTTLLTGTTQRHHGIPGHRWVNRPSRTIRNYIGPQFTQVNADIRQSAATIFERHPEATGIAIQSVVRRGAQLRKTLLRLNSEAILRRAARLIVQHPRSVAVVWLPNGDAAAHRGGPHARGVVADMVAASRGLGYIVRALRQERLLATSRLLLVADHGHREVSHRAPLAPLLRSVGLRALHNPRHWDPDVAIALSSGDSAAYLYLPPGNDEPAIGQRLAKRREVELVCWRSHPQQHYIFSSGGTAKFEVVNERLIDYQLIDGQDPLHLDLAPAASRIDLSHVDLIREERYPDFLYQYLNSFVAGRSSNMLVFAAPGWHFSRAPRLGQRLGFHRGSHGGPFPEEMLVAAAVRGVDSFPSGPVRMSDLLGTLGLMEGELARSVSDPTLRSEPGG